MNKNALIRWAVHFYASFLLSVFNFHFRQCAVELCIFRGLASIVGKIAGYFLVTITQLFVPICTSHSHCPGNEILGVILCKLNVTQIRIHFTLFTDALFYLSLHFI